MMTSKILFFTAFLFASAAVGYPANEIDWGKGRPGVRVVTNAPSRAEFDALVSGNSQYASVAANASNANYASVSALSSNALTAVSVTGPQSNVIANAASVAYVDTLVQTNHIKTVWDTENPKIFTRWENGTGTVYLVSSNGWWLDNVDLEPQIVAGMPYPLVLGTWEEVAVSLGDGGITNITYFGAGEQQVVSPYDVFYSFQQDFNTDLFYGNVTTLLFTVAAQTDVDALSARVDAIELTPESVSLYGDLNTTNTPGYAGYTVANGTARSVTLVPVETITTNTANFEYQIGSNGFVSATAIAQAFGSSGAFGSSVMTLLDANDVPLASNTFTAGTFASAATGRPYFTNSLTYSAGFVTNAKLRVSYTMWRTNTSGFASQLFTGTTYPMTLTCKTAALPYVTFDQSESRYAKITTVNFTNGTTLSDGVINGTNAVKFVKNGTNYWITLP